MLCSPLGTGELLCSPLGTGELFCSSLEIVELRYSPPEIAYLLELPHELWSCYDSSLNLRKGPDPGGGRDDYEGGCQVRTAQEELGSSPVRPWSVRCSHGIFTFEYHYILDVYIS